VDKPARGWLMGADAATGSAIAQHASQFAPAWEKEVGQRARTPQWLQESGAGSCLPLIVWIANHPAGAPAAPFPRPGPPLAKRARVAGTAWTRGYFVSTVGRDEEVIREYIRHQEEEDKRVDQMKLWR
jgi:hypothetical protein